MERRLLLDVVVTQRAAVLELLAREDQPLLVRRDALLVLDFLFDVVYRVARFDVQRDGLARQRLDEDLRARARRRRGARGARFLGEMRGDGVGRVRSRAPRGDSVGGLLSRATEGRCRPIAVRAAPQTRRRARFWVVRTPRGTCMVTELAASIGTGQ